MSVKRARGSSSGRAEASPAVALTVPLILPVTLCICVARDRTGKTRASMQSEIRIRLRFPLIIKATNLLCLKFWPFASPGKSGFLSIARVPATKSAQNVLQSVSGFRCQGLNRDKLSAGESLSLCVNTHIRNTDVFPSEVVVDRTRLDVLAPGRSFFYDLFFYESVNKRKESGCDSASEFHSHGSDNRDHEDARENRRGIL